ncbi:Trk family potassium uptake protein [Hazenella sp. IB182357]|uniref:Trk family potassium uptake protein n=2 Tax=Polycladospora coralii TaxID=2771432 RepID=A0A926RTS7_9BACL|nr:Trk family potassium uptake protein [Polycladospora coralii]MBS7531727.1 TrkH family potassium uptake protein [Polycladospora coralii]
MKSMNQLLRTITPSQILVLGFLSFIMIGAFLLKLPVSSANGDSISFLDALFTATSALSVTGLNVVNPGETFSLFGEIVILCLIQVGGLGFMAFTTLFAFLIGKKIGFKERLLLLEAFNKVDFRGIVKMIRYILIFTAVIEGIGFVLLSIRFVPQFGIEKGMYFALFHSISAFNNAGFDLFGTSLLSYQTDFYVNLVISSLFIIGGIGFVLIIELLEYRYVRRVSLHTKMVLAMTGILVFVGTLLVLAIEWNNPSTLGALPIGDKLLAGYFHAVTPRTAGFDSLGVHHLYPATLFITIMLMFVGASPSSTGGGIKTTTLFTLLLAVWSMIRGRNNIVIFKRRIPYDAVYKALTVTVLSLTLVLVVTMILTITEHKHADLLMILFEAVSAFGTVGLTMGLTPLLTDFGKVLIIFVMIIGRLGPITLAYAIAKSKRQKPYRYPEEKPLIG